MKADVSIIIPCYNAEKYIGQCIESVLNQTYTNYECIVVDDGSVDNSETIINSYIKSDYRIKYLYKKNEGVSSARNYGIKEAKGEWIQLLDSDDILLPDKIEKQIEYCNNYNNLQNYIMAYSDYIVRKIDEKENLLDERMVHVNNLNKESILLSLIKRKFGVMAPISVNSILLSVNIFDKYVFNDKFKNYGDVDFFYRILHDKLICCYVPIISMVVQNINSSLSRNMYKSRKGYLQFLNTVYNTNKNHLKEIPNFKNLIEISLLYNDRHMYNDILFILRNSEAPVFLDHQNNKKNVRKWIKYLSNIGCSYFILKCLFITKRFYKYNRIKIMSINKFIYSFTKKKSKSLLIKINNYLNHLSMESDKASMPSFKNNPKDLIIRPPREIKNPDRIIIGDYVKFEAYCTLKAINQYPGTWLKHPENNHIEHKFENSTIIIGNRVTSSGNLYIAAAEKVEIEDDVMFAPNVFISDCTHGYANADVPYKYQGLVDINPVKIKRGSWIGKNVVILPGVVVGELSIIGANSVVTKNVPDRCIAAGSPARIIKKWCSSTKKWISN